MVEARADGRLRLEPKDSGPPVGYWAFISDPDGHTLRFYTIEHHTDMAPGEVTTIHDPRETAERLEREEASRG